MENLYITFREPYLVIAVAIIIFAFVGLLSLVSIYAVKAHRCKSILEDQKVSIDVMRHKIIARDKTIGELEKDLLSVQDNYNDALITINTQSGIIATKCDVIFEDMPQVFESNKPI